MTQRFHKKIQIYDIIREIQTMNEINKEDFRNGYRICTNHTMETGRKIRLNILYHILFDCPLFVRNGVFVGYYCIEPI